MYYQSPRGRKKILKPARFRLKWVDEKSLSKFQSNLKRYLKILWRGDIVLEECSIGGFGTPLYIDFYNVSQSIVVEAQGEQHLKMIPHFHKGLPKERGGNELQARMNFGAQIRRDMLKCDFCRLNNFRYLEIERGEWIALGEDEKMEFLKNALAMAEVPV